MRQAGWTLGDFAACNLLKLFILIKSISHMVPKKGLEPPHPCEYMDLNHARLPIPPLRHRRLNRLDLPVRQQFQVSQMDGTVSNKLLLRPSGNAIPWAWKRNPWADSVPRRRLFRFYHPSVPSTYGGATAPDGVAAPIDGTASKLREL